MPDTDVRRIIAQLEQFGCNEREAKIYVRLLAMGPSSVQEIAKQVKGHRVTVYSATEQLVKKGLLYETKRGRRRLLAAEPPDVLYHIVQQREHELHVLKSNLDHVVGLLKPMQTHDTSLPAVKLYEGVDGFKKMLEETLSARGEVLVFTYVDLFSRLIDPDYLEHYFERRAKKGIRTRLIFPPCTFAQRVNKRAAAYKIQVRLLPPELVWKSGIFLWNDCVAIQAFTEGKLSCTIIENKDIAHFYRRIIFELVWGLARAVD